MDEDKSLYFLKDKIKKSNSDKFAEGETWSIRMASTLGGSGEAKQDGDVTIVANK